MKSRTEVRNDGSMLTAGFHRANPPLIWRFDLERNHSFTLTLQGEEGDWELGVTSPRGEFYSVAHFDAREDAEEAFVKVERSLTRNKPTWFTQTMRALAIVGALLVLGFFGTAIFMGNSHQAGNGTPIASSAGASGEPSVVAPQVAAPKPGEPISADEILTPPTK